MPRRKTVSNLTHDEAKRLNIPTAEYEAVLDETDRSPIQVAYLRRNPDLDPQLVWRGKDLLDWSDLVVQVPPLFIQEKVHPKVLIDDLISRTRQSDRDRAGTEAGFQADLFADFNGLPDDAAQTEFYQHDANWSNRMILGDSLQVMASLAERDVVTLGVRKPHPLTYTTTADRMGLSVSECLFVDDMQINLDGAEAVGMPGFFFDHTRVAASCNRLLDLLAPPPEGHES